MLYVFCVRSEEKDCLPCIKDSFQSGPEWYVYVIVVFNISEDVGLRSQPSPLKLCIFIVIPGYPLYSLISRDDPVTTGCLIYSLTSWMILLSQDV